MPRRLKSPAEVAEVKKKAEAVLRGRELLGPMKHKTKKKRSKSSRGVSKVLATRFIAEVDTMLEDGEMTDLSPRHWVALFCWLHEAIYDVTCVEEVRPEWNTASSRAAAMLAEEFDGDEEQFLAYVRWVAKREEETELWRRSNRKPGRRLVWRDVFMLKRKLTDYRLNLARTDGVK